MAQSLEKPEDIELLTREKRKENKTELQENVLNTLNRHLTNYVKWVVPQNPSRSELVQKDIDEPDGAHKYDAHYSCWPPCLGIILISVIELSCYCADELLEKDSTLTGTGPVAKILIYNPRRRYEAWRYLTYMFVHIGKMHLALNIAFKFLFGLPLELVHNTWRVMLVYFLGVIAGSLATSIFDSNSALAGASGGVYALITANIATIIMNWKEINFRYPLILFYISFIAIDVGNQVYNIYFLKYDSSISVSAHFGGAMSGLLVGFWVLKTFEPTERENIIWWCALTLYIALMGILVLLNFCWKQHFLISKPYFF